MKFVMNGGLIASRLMFAKGWVAGGPGPIMPLGPIPDELLPIWSSKMHRLDSIVNQGFVWVYLL